MQKVRINDLARELEVKSKSILDALTAVGVTEKKTHSSSIEEHAAEQGGAFLTRGPRPAAAPRHPTDSKPSFTLSHVSKPGDALKAILERKQAEAAAKSRPPAAAPRPTVAAPAAAAAARPAPPPPRAPPAPRSPPPPPPGRLPRPLPPAPRSRQRPPHRQPRLSRSPR